MTADPCKRNEECGHHGARVCGPRSRPSGPRWHSERELPWAMQPISFLLELDEEEKKLLATWMMIVQEQLERKDKHYWNINARANRLRAKIRDLRPVS